MAPRTSFPKVPGRILQSFYRSRRRYATGATAILALGMGYHVIFGQNGLTAYQQKRQNTVALNKDIGSLERENELLRAHVDRLQNDSSAIEHQAREELHYTRPGEVIYTLPVAPVTSPVAPVQLPVTGSK